MFKKNLPLIFLAIVFLSFDNKTQAMQESDLESTSEKTTLQRDTFNCEHEPCNTLKFLAASALIKILETQGINLNALDPENENHRRILETIPVELIEYCHKYPIKPIIHNHIASLEQFKEHECLKITDENLNNYNRLLHQLVNSIDIRDINIEAILFAINNNFKSAIRCYPYSNITLKDINVILKLLMQPKDVDILDQEKTCLNNIWDFIWVQNCHALFKLLAGNRKLLPPLNHIISSNQILDGKINGLMFLVRYKIDINLFKLIIDEEKNKNYDWKQLLSMRIKDGNTILHCAAIRCSKDILEVILELIKEKGLHNLINIQTHSDETALMIAANFGDDEIVKLLIDHGANINISSDRSWRTALYYATMLKKISLLIDHINPERLKKIDQCIELLTTK